MRFAPRNLLHFFPLFFLIRPALRVHIGEQRTERKVEGERERERERESVTRQNGFLVNRRADSRWR